jgi:hypothetical protein
MLDETQRQRQAPKISMVFSVLQAPHPRGSQGKICSIGMATSKNETES